MDEINDLRDLMEQMDERIESRSALMEDNYDNILKPKHVSFCSKGKEKGLKWEESENGHGQSLKYLTFPGARFSISSSTSLVVPEDFNL